MCRSEKKARDVEVVLKITSEVSLNVDLKPKARGDRRDRTDVVVQNRYSVWHKYWIQNRHCLYNEPDPVPPHRYHKRGVWTCGCSKRQKGRPKVNSGLCNIGDRDRIISWRQDNRTLRNMLRWNGLEWDDDDVAYLFQQAER